MFAANVVYEIGSWLLLIMQCGALLLAMSWPVLRGKGWLVASLSVLVLAEVCSLLLRWYLNHPGNNLMGPEGYRQMMTYSFLISLMTLVGWVLFVVALSQLRSQLRQLISLLKVEQGET